jgi:hypothetical protein
MFLPLLSRSGGQQRTGSRKTTDNKQKYTTYGNRWTIDKDKEDYRKEVSGLMARKCKDNTRTAVLWTRDEMTLLQRKGEAEILLSTGR